QAIRPDLVPTGPSDVRVRRRDEIAASRGVAVDVDPEDLAEKGVQALGSVSRVARRTAIAHPGVEEPVRTERDVAAVVIDVRLGDREHPPAGEGHAGRGGWRQAAFVDGRGPGQIGEVDVELA